MAKGHSKRCLIVERHSWETGFAQEQLQIPLDAAEEFFGPGETRRAVRVRIPGAGPQEYPCRISKVYSKSRTRRVNGLHLVGLMGPCFVFFQETDDGDLYDFWCQYDMPIVVAHYNEWNQARDSQYGRGRLFQIVCAPIPRPITRVDD